MLRFRKDGCSIEKYPETGVSGVERGEREDTKHCMVRLRRESVDPPWIQVSLQFTTRCRFRRIDISLPVWEISVHFVLTITDVYDSFRKTIGTEKDTRESPR